MNSLLDTLNRLEIKQRHLYRLLESARDAVIEMNAEGIVTSWNRSAEEILGWKASEAMGKKMSSLIVPPEYRQAHEEGLKNFLITGVATTTDRLLEIEALRKDGERIAVELSIFTVSTNVVVSFAAFIRDITSRRHTQTSLRRSEERSRSVVEHVSDGMIVIQSNQIVFSNNRTAEIFRTTKDELQNNGFFYRVHPEDRDILLTRVFSDQSQSIPSGRLDIRWLDPQGLECWLSVGASAVPWDGESAVLVFLADVTVERRLSRTVLQSTQRYRAVVEHAQEGLLVVKQQYIVLANSAAIEIAAMSGEKMEGLNYLNLVHPDDQKLLLERECLLLDGRPTVDHLELRLARFNGSPRWISASLAAVPWDGELAILVYFSDITKRRRLEGKLQSTLEERETVLGNSLVGIAFFTPDGEPQWANRALKTMFGTPQKSEQPFDWRFFFCSAADSARFSKHSSECLNQGRTYQSDLQMQRDDSTQFWVTASGKPVGGVVAGQGSVWTVMDITIRKKLELALALVFSEREAIFNNLLVGISYNVDRQIRWVNEKYAEIIGYSTEELLGKSTRLLYASDEEYEAHGRETREILKRDGLHVEERQFTRRDGDLRWVQIAGRCVQNRDPDRGVIWTLLDVTERRQAEEKTRTALRRELELNDRRSRFITMTSHEFRTPLAAILSSSELLRDYADRMPLVQKDELFAQIETSVQKMMAMLNKVLLLGRLDAKNHEFLPQLVKIDEICGLLIEDVKVAHASTDSQVVVQLSPAGMEGIFDPELLRYILENLLSNAMKYSLPGRPISLTVATERERTVLEVTNEGIGIPPHEMAHLFEPFHRAENSNDIQGTGLGLAIVKKAVELHGGAIEARSTAGGRTSFTVTLWQDTSSPRGNRPQTVP